MNRKLIIKDGMYATLKEKNGSIPIIICNVKTDSTGTYFNATNRNTNRLIRKNGRIAQWSAYYALKTETVVIDFPEYEEFDTTNKTTVEFDKNLHIREELKKFFEKNVIFNNNPFTLDEEQLNAVLSENHTQVIARAGSGKTRVLVAKMVYLFEKKLLNENNVLAFCFNKDAAKEICDRINNKCLIDGELKYLNYDIAKTFHSFSRGSLDIKGQILADRTKLIKLIINQLRKEDVQFSKDVYNFFRKDTLRIDRKKFYKIEDYYKYIRNCEFQTLNGEKVKSRVEKFIADFLFENGVNYIYEKSFYPYKISFEKSALTKDEINKCIRFIDGKKETIPDFYLPDYNIVWEHWGVDGTETKEERNAFELSVGSYTDYLKNRDWKQKFWNSYWRNKLNYDNKYNRAVKSIVKLIETSNNKFSTLSREQVETQIAAILRANNIRYSKLPEDVLVRKVWENAIDGFTILIDQFINKLQQNYFDNINLFLDRIKNIEDEKTLTYYKLGYKIYKKYIEILSSSNNVGDFAIFNNYLYDFNQIIYECSKKILNGELDNQIRELKWVLIDEYQDFSRLFDYLINALLSRNNEIKLFCVGDDWQAINRFAGSDLQYFQTFISRFHSAEKYNIRTNYRSSSHIVSYANMFMNKCNMEGERPKGKLLKSGECREYDIDKLYIGNFDENNIYLKYLNEKESHRVEKARYLKYCSDIIKNNRNKKIMILHRKNTIYSMDLENFDNILKKICLSFMDISEYNNNVVVKTVHTSKGEEADVVIILDVNEGSFPVYSLNNELFEIFGHSTIDTIEDEQRLYYVALTRAKSNLYILYEESNKSDFIMSNTP